MTTQQQLLIIILPTESLESAAAHEKPESLTHQEYCVLSGFYPQGTASASPPTFYREATLRGVVEITEDATRYLDALREHGIIFGYRIDGKESGEIPAILPEDIILTEKDSAVEGSARAWLAFDPECSVFAEEPDCEVNAVGHLWQEYGQAIIDHIAKRCKISDMAKSVGEPTAGIDGREPGG